jgi:dienelactone hydrolase
MTADVAGYYETLPARYRLTTKSYPLIIFIHGIGELGTGVARLNCCGVPYWAKNKLLPPTYTVNGTKFSPIYISPQFKWRPNASEVQAVINYAVRKYRVDPTRIYVTGLSMGGGSTLDYSVALGNNVAAIAEVCGGTKPTTSMASQLASKNIPVWGIYSNGDQTVPVSWGVNWFNWLRAARPSNPNLKLTIYSGLSHNGTWGRAFNPTSRTDGFNVYEWLLRFRKGSAPVASQPPASGNAAPKAVAGPDQYFSLSKRKSVFLNGAWSTDVKPGWITKYVYTKISGPGATMQRLNLTQYMANYIVAGTYVFRLTVTDNKGATSWDDLKVVVSK